MPYQQFAELAFDEQLGVMARGATTALQWHIFALFARTRDHRIYPAFRRAGGASDAIAKSAEFSYLRALIAWGNGE